MVGRRGPGRSMSSSTALAARSAAGRSSSCVRAAGSRPEAELADRDAGSPQRSAFHCWSPSVVDRRGGAVLLVGDVLAPGDGAAALVGLLHRDVRHEATRGGAVPVVLAGLEVDAVA